MIYYPVFLNVESKKCLVVGGGLVAFRKVTVLLEHKALIEVISPELSPELNELAEKGKIKVRPHAYRKGDLTGAFLVIAATDDKQANQKIAAEARSRGILVNAADDATNSDFISPSYFRRGAITIAVSTSGLSPALARKIRASLEETVNEHYITLIHLVAEVRTDLKKRGIKVPADRWQEALDLDLLLKLITKGKTEKAKAALLHSLQSDIK